MTGGKNIALVLSYVGTAYHGWQRQENAHTVQQALEEALARLTGEAVTLHGCGRTDAGVHARRYAASFQTRSAVPPEKYPVALIPFLPGDISVLESREVSPAFNARFSCVEKEYVYKLYTGRVDDPFLKDRAWRLSFEPDVGLLSRAAAHFAGEHDFSAFCGSKSAVRSEVRTVFSCEARKNGEVTDIKISASGFLYNMARIITGTLVSVAAGKIAEGDVPALIKGKDRAAAGATAPACGLYMNRIRYDGWEIF